MPRCAPPGITYVGELGWELYVPTEFAVGVYEDLVAAGADLGLVDAGYYAINSLRLDKGYRAFGSDLTPDHTPLEAGLRFTCKLETPIDFVGRAALESAIADGAPPSPRLPPGRRSRRHAVGRRARPPRRRTGRPGHVGGLVGHLWGGRRPGLRLAEGPWPGGPGDLATGVWEVVAGDAAPIDVQLEALYDPTSARVRG